MIRKLSFDEVYPIWKNYLWPNRTSEIETHSAMLWPFDGETSQYDLSVFDNPVTYLGEVIDNKIVGIFSGFKTNDTQYRLRGAYVDPNYRNKGILTNIIKELHKQAISEKALMVWCTPRQSSLNIYLRLGYTTHGDFFDTEVGESNIYVSKQLDYA